MVIKKNIEYYFKILDTLCYRIFSRSENETFSLSLIQRKDGYLTKLFKRIRVIFKFEPEIVETK